MLATHYLSPLPINATGPPVVTRQIDDAAVHFDSERISGSGVVLLNGSVLTAAHLFVKEDAHFKILQKGQEQGTPITILWQSKDYDIALVSPQAPLHEHGREISCRQLQIGEPITITGFPGDAKVPMTSAGIVSAFPPKDDQDPWTAMAITDATMSPGVSGAAVLDISGHIVGIAVGMIGDQIRMFRAFLPSGYNIFVPSTAICPLFART